MAIDYSSLQATATRLLTENGQSITLTYQTAEVINPATGVVTTPATTNTISGYGIATNYDKSEIDGNAIQSSDIRLLISNISTAPGSGWTASVDGKVHRVMDVRQIKPAGTNIMYILQLRV